MVTKAAATKQQLTQKRLYPDSIEILPIHSIVMRHVILSQLTTLGQCLKLLGELSQSSVYGDIPLAR